MNNIARDKLEWHKRYDNIDGTGDMLFGLMLLGFALLGHLQAVLAEWTRTHGTLGNLLFMYAVLIPVVGLAFWIRRVIKRYITWPRTGYVAGHSVWSRTSSPSSAGGEGAAGVPTRRGMWAAMVAIALVAAIVAAGFACLMGFAGRHHAASLARGAFLAFWVALYAFWVSRMGRRRPWRWLLVIFMALGLLAISVIVPGGFTELASPATLFIGLVWLAGGGLTLFSYVRNTRPPTPGTE